MHYEVKYIWPSKWSLTKVLFLCTRYPAFIDTSLVIWREFMRSLALMHENSSASSSVQFGHNLSPNVCTTLYDLIGCKMAVVSEIPLSHHHYHTGLIMFGIAVAECSKPPILYSMLNSDFDLFGFARHHYLADSSTMGRPAVDQVQPPGHLHPHLHRCQCCPRKVSKHDAM